MRIWSVHPKYLDTKGLVALWRETLLAKNVLENKTRGYRNHPQLTRFLNSENPVNSINCYLLGVYKESLTRNFHFNKNKIGTIADDIKLSVTTGQILFEKAHLLSKLKERDPKRFIKFSQVEIPDLHPVFYQIEGSLENWEKIQ
jgi:hypothetical protein